MSLKTAGLYDRYVYDARVLRVVDGDTLEMEIDLGFKILIRHKVRLAAVDTPEVFGVKRTTEEYRKGKLATEFTKDWVKKHGPNLLIRTYKTGKYGRYIATVFNKDADTLNLQLQLWMDEMDARGWPDEDDE